MSRQWDTQAESRRQRLQRAAALAPQGRVVAADDVVALLEAVIEPGDRVCLEGNNQKQADFL
ncbi:MAG: malonate decarboxylase subunit alpha, partial [Xanthomonas perforans]|nr:malonate decarboxylase subunit alpha [Xanthomonas perforans]